MSKKQPKQPKPNGRPPKFKSPEEVYDKATKYFDSTPPEEWTITGLALALDTSRETLMDYQNKDIFSDTIKKLKLRIHNQYELDLRRRGRSSDIFALKNFGWSDKTEITGELTQIVKMEQVTINGKTLDFDIGD